MQTHLQQVARQDESSKVSLTCDFLCNLKTQTKIYYAKKRFLKRFFAGELLNLCGICGISIKILIKRFKSK